jgi:putative zinc finger/helix-turn-helix YgiT family protein
MDKCKACSSADIKILQSNEAIKYKGGNLKVAMDYSVCKNCSREFISKKQILANEVRIREVKKEFDGLMSSEEIKTIRLSLGLTQEQAACKCISFYEDKCMVRAADRQQWGAVKCMVRAADRQQWGAV